MALNLCGEPSVRQVPHNLQSNYVGNPHDDVTIQQYRRQILGRAKGNGPHNSDANGVIHGGLWLSLYGTIIIPQLLTLLTQEHSRI